MTYTLEAQFEAALIAELSNKGWEKAVLKNPTESDLLNNWAQILFENNRERDRLNDTPLTDGEMQQVLEQIAKLKTPLKLNGFINGKTVAITRDNPADTLHFGLPVSLKIYDRREIAAGQSRYQIVQQPRFKSQNKILNERRGDLMLLINGMPVFHIELKKSGVAVSQAYHQIEKYSQAGLFTGLFALVQVFVAMEPQETVYFANPGPDGKFNKDFYFHWADFNNEPINDWKAIAGDFLSIPMAHQMIGFYTVADDNDGVLKVMRSYQYYAARAISTKVAKTDWSRPNQLGGFVWHTTGSGKTMTSFKSAQLIANSKDADKVIFLMDRIELGTQSLLQYQGFADENEDVQATENTGILVTKLKSDDPANTLIVTSIQKMSNIKDDDGGLSAHDIELMRKKRIVFIVDEAHRSTFGDMLITIKQTFGNALFFGFTGTPIHDENQRQMNTTTTVFGNELHRYSIADGIRDKNVLGFDPYKVMQHIHFLKTLTWYALPALPIALWGLWRFRTQMLKEEKFQLLSSFFIISLLLIGLGADRRDIHALPFLLPIAMLAGGSLETLKRGATGLLNWFGLMLFGFLSTLIWLGWLAMTTGWPAKLSLRMKTLSAISQPQINGLALAIALAITLVGLIVIYNAKRSTRAAITVWAVGMTMTWGLLMTLWLPWIDAAKSYENVMLNLKSALPKDYICITSQRLGAPQQALLEYYTGIQTQRFEITQRIGCDLYLIQDEKNRAKTEPGADWKLIWQGKRASDRWESFRLYQYVSYHT